MMTHHAPGSDVVPEEHGRMTCRVCAWLSARARRCFVWRALRKQLGLFRPVGSESGPWYDSRMKKRGSQPNRRRSTSGVILGRERFAKISAVEGIELTPRMKQRAAEFDRRGLSAEERRRSIVRAYRKV